VLALGETVAVAPPPWLRERVLAEIAVTNQLPPAMDTWTGAGADDARDVVPATGSLPLPSRRKGRTPRRRPRWQVAAVAVLLAGLGGVAGVAARGVLDREGDEGGRIEARSREILGIAGDPAARRVSGRLQGGGSVSLVVAGTRAAFIADDAPGLASDRAYQLWIVRPGQVASAGMGPSGTDAAGSWGRVVAGLKAGDKVAVTVEPSGGSTAPTTTPLTALQV